MTINRNSNASPTPPTRGNRDNPPSMRNQRRLTQQENRENNNPIVLANPPAQEVNFQSPRTVIDVPNQPNSPQRARTRNVQPRQIPSLEDSSPARILRPRNSNNPFRNPDSNR